jgi:hypothetical protein
MNSKTIYVEIFWSKRLHFIFIFYFLEGFNFCFCYFQYFLFNLWWFSIYGKAISYGLFMRFQCGGSYEVFVRVSLLFVWIIRLPLSMLAVFACIRCLRDVDFF